MNNLGIQLRISDLLFAVQKRWKLIISLFFLGLALGVLLTAMGYVQSSVQSYQVKGSLILSAVNSNGLYSSNSVTPSRNDLSLASDMYDTVYYLLRSDRLLYQVINDKQMLGVSASDIRSGLSISRYNDTTIINLSLTWDNGEEGLILWNAVVDMANRLMPDIFKVGKLSIVNEPQISVVGASKSGSSTGMILPVLGLVAGMGFSVLEVLMRPTLINVKDVETVFGLETIGIIPYDNDHFRKTKSLLIKDEGSSSEVLQNFSAAAYILRNRIGTKEKNHCFYITSTIGQEGRTVVAANLAIQLSDMEKHVLLIDFDYRNPMVGSLFLNNLDYNHSMNALYRGEITFSEAITTLTGYLDLLPMVMEHDLMYMDNAIIDMISQMKEDYDYIIIDAPPVGKESETLSLNQVANTVLFVARYDTASMPEIQAALDKLEKSGIRILGCIVNGVKSTRNVIMGTPKSKTTKKSSTAAKKKTTGLPGFKKEETKENDAAVQDLTSREKSRSRTKKKKTGKSSADAKSAAFGFFKKKPETDAPAAEQTKPAGQGDAGAFFSDENAAQQPEQPAAAPGVPRMEEWQEPNPTAETFDFGPPETFAQPPAPSLEKPEPAAADTFIPQEPVPEPAGSVPLPQPETEIPAKPEELNIPEAIPEAPHTAAIPDVIQATADMVAIQEDSPATADEAAIQESPAEEPKAPPKKRGLFGGKPKEPKAPRKSAKPGKEEAPAQETAPSDQAKPAKKTKPAKEKKAKAAPVKVEKISKEPEKKKKPGFLSWGKARKPEEDPFEKIKANATVIHKSRNVFEDLMDTGPSEPRSRTDEEITEALLKMGLDGSWDSKDGGWENKDSSAGEAPKTQNKKRNLFDDL